MKVRTRIAPSPTGFPHVELLILRYLTCVLLNSTAVNLFYVLRIQINSVQHLNLKNDFLDSLRWLG